MIDKKNFKDVLLAMGFKKESIGNYYKKKFGDNCMAVDFDNQQLHYPDGVTKGDNTTSNFSHDENFVVFECVNRLMEKGYLPEDIELEPRWRLGHESKTSGKPDILIKDREGNNLIIIECKTAGKEYRKEKNNTETDGGQLFSYWQQDNTVKWLALYASDWDGKEIVYDNDVINCTDDANIVKMSERDKDVKVFVKARNDQEKFEVWRDTYNCQWLHDIIFSEDSQPYQIQLKPLRKQDLRDFNPDDKIVNQFEEILRHNNVSDKENAFNRLVALFICKLVDEIKKQDYEEVDFQYKYTDTYESLQDRLQRLHQQGMEEFMKEKIFYVDDGYAERLFQQYTGQKRKAAIEDLKRTIRILKFYSNNDFAFKDVHNEELFYQNGKILVEVVQLFQPYRIVYPSKHQFLGDLFEQLLNKGFKQNEGQFFTPTPITRFVWDSLPVSCYISEHGLPLVIDFACGAGHFLTEGVEAINELRSDSDSDNSWVEKHIFGIEKDYRLARVSKVSMFMNGAGGSNIIFGDGLENYPEKGINPNSFDILVANPPYSVSGFKRHLALHNNTFQLLDKITLTGSEIEVLFVERISQLLKPQGIAAVILPASILSNGSASYTAAREQLLQNFLVRAIVAFGSKTFGATGTNTVTLFLEKYNEPPRKAELTKDFVTAVVDNHLDDGWEDHVLLRKYLSYQNEDADIYRRFLDRDLNWEELDNDKYLKVYYDAFKSQPLTIPKNIKTAEDEEKFRRDKFYDYAIGVEREKLYYFALVEGQHTLVVNGPSDNKEQKAFLGYDWSNRKGDEGIKIVNPGGMLYNDEDRSARGTIACAIRNSFEDAHTELGEDKEKFVKWNRLADMVEFSTETFGKVIKLNSNQFIRPSYLYSTVPLASIIQSVPDSNKKINKEDIEVDGKYPVITQENGNLVAGYTDEDNPIDNVPVIVFGDHSCSFKYVDFPFFRGADGTQLFQVDNTKAILKYVYYFLPTVSITNSDKYERHFKYLKQVDVPLPPLSVQQQIVKECEDEDKVYKEDKKEVEKLNSEIKKLISNVNGEAISLGDVAQFSSERKAYKDIDPDSYITTDNMLQNCEGVVSYNGTPNIDTIVAYHKGDILLSNIRPYLKKLWLADRVGGCSPDVLVLQVDKDKAIPEFVYYSLRNDEFFNFIMSDIKGLKMPRGKKETIVKYGIKLPNIADQQKIVSEISALDTQVAKLRVRISETSSRKQAILDKYLK